MSLIGLLGLGFGGTVGVSTSPFGDYTTADALTTPLELLAIMIADCPTFRTQCGLAADDALAQEKLLEGKHGSRQRVFFLEDQSAQDVIESVVEHLPIAIVEWDEEGCLHFSKKAGGEKNFLRPSGMLRVYLADRDRGGGNMKQSARAFSRFAGPLLHELSDQAAYDDRLAIDDIVMDMSPKAPSIAEQSAIGQLYWATSAKISWEA